MREDYNNVQMTVELADGQTVYNIDYISVYCYEVGVNFGHVNINLDPSSVTVPAYLPPLRDRAPPAVRDTRRC